MNYPLNIKLLLVILHQEHDNPGIWKFAYSKLHTTHDSFLKLVTWEGVDAWQGDEMRFYFAMRLSMNQRIQDVVFLSRHYKATKIQYRSRGNRGQTYEFMVNEYLVPIDDRTLDTPELNRNQSPAIPEGRPPFGQLRDWSNAEERPRTPIQPGTTNDFFWNLWLKKLEEESDDSNDGSEGTEASAP